MRPRHAPLLCLLAVLGLHVVALRDAPTWLARPAQAASLPVTSPAPVRSVSTRRLEAPTLPTPAGVAEVVPAVAPAKVAQVARTARVENQLKPLPVVVASNDFPASATASATVASAAAAAPAPAAPATTAASAASAISPPAPVRLDYALKRGAISGEARLVWRHDGQRYTLDLEGQLPLIGTLMHQHSEGGFDAAGLAPLRYTEKRLRRSERAVSFNRPADGQPGRITFSASTGEAALRAGAQDRVSWMVQLAARLAGTATLPPSGSRIEMDVASAGGDVQDWHFVLQGRAADGSWHWRRDTGEPDATQAEVWTDPAGGHWPRRVRLTERQGEPIELVLQRR
ncbi:DUF3108 domain-containing protein [Leptothrix discophora]|uniref:DUF3108 domain-containing protein n=1 Tax=Leptothrix discophora TaxID=89 RepID=A0ABT9G885_LEPDI|nr:DUF3108 domain-containing protein [Leptothrix discophora]MDP4302699.1 DUF3108 domain-containing protein [Leptothrix discophora]